MHKLDLGVARYRRNRHGYIDTQKRCAAVVHEISMRVVPYISKPDQETGRRISLILGDAAECPRFFLLANPGPTSFVVKEGIVPSEEDTVDHVSRDNLTYRVLVGSRQKCSCGMTDGLLCLHVLFVMIKVLRVPQDNALCWQLSLLDAELDTVLEFRQRESRTRQRKHDFLKRRSGGGGGARCETSVDVIDSDTDIVPVLSSMEEYAELDETQRPDLPDTNESCAICMDSLVLGTGVPLTYCVKSCGNFFHARCIIEYGSHQLPQPVNCPLCRSLWGGEEIVATLKKKLQKASPAGSKGSNIHVGVKCAHCATRPLVGDRYRCVKCFGHVDLCSTCFNRGVHGRHQFVLRHLVGDSWQPAPRTKRRSRSQLWRPVNGMAGLSAAEVAALQFRDIVPEDYQSLLGLDHNGALTTTPEIPESLGAYLAGSLAPLTSLVTACVECGSRNAILGDDLVQYPCSHGVHRSCAATAAGKPNPCCPQCQEPIYPGLTKQSIDRAKQRPSLAPQTNDAKKPLQQPLAQALSIQSVCGQSERSHSATQSREGPRKQFQPRKQLLQAKERAEAEHAIRLDMVADHDARRQAALHHRLELTAARARRVDCDERIKAAACRRNGPNLPQLPGLQGICAVANLHRQQQASNRSNKLRRKQIKRPETNNNGLSLQSDLSTSFFPPAVRRQSRLTQKKAKLRRLGGLATNSRVLEDALRVQQNEAHTLGTTLNQPSFYTKRIGGRLEENAGSALGEAQSLSNLSDLPADHDRNQSK